jgi:hypothetical protein
VLLIGFIVSCNNKHQIEPIKHRKWLNPDEKLDLFHLDLKVKVNADDEFKVYYTEDNNMNFNEEKTIRIKVRKDTLYQNVTFNFPKNTKPTNIRIDLGFSKDQKLINFERMSFVFKDRNFEIAPSELLKYFSLNDNQIDWNLSTVSFKMKNLNADTYYPFIYSTDSLKNPLKKILDY